MSLNYWNTSYHYEGKHSNHVLKVDKVRGTDWCDIKLETNGERDGRITITSKEQAEHLAFMLKQMLSNESG